MEAPQRMTNAREQGDGAPVTPSSSPESESIQEVATENESKPFTIKFEVDIIQLLLTVFALATRTWRLGIPRAVVFDELHFAKFVSLYLKRIFFFDVHPPLGKMILAVAGSFTGFEGDVNFERIGAEFPASVPVEALRVIPALCGSFTVPLVYQICVEAGLHRWSAAVAATLVALDNGLLVQSRFMLMEAMLVFFSCLAVLSYLKFRNCRREFSLTWWLWLCLTGLAMTFTLSVKYVGVFTALLLAVRVWRDFWRMLDDHSKTDMILLQHMCARVLGVCCVPVTVYLTLFYAHLSVLHRAGPHDNVMTSQFQASLEGGLAALTKGQPLNVAYGSQITLRHTENLASGQPCWLHSHAHMYPVKYPDKRGSSHQQQVTCYVFKDINNWWIIKHPERSKLMVSDPPEPVKHGDVVQLIHGITSRALNSHDVAAPVTPSNQEVSCYVNYNVSMPAQSLWRVEIVNREADDQPWQTIHSQVRLVHVNTSAAIKTTGKQLPEWGFNQLEVSADRVVQQKNTVWNVEEHRYTRSGDADQQKGELQSAPMIPLQPTHMSFWAKFAELQVKMLTSSQDARMEHKYSSGPGQWPLLAKNIAYWMSRSDNAQIHLLGNLVVWYASFAAVLCLSALYVFYLLRRQRQIYDVSPQHWEHFLFVLELFVGGYLLHYLPYFMEDRTLFLHHYLPSVVFKVISLAVIGDHLYKVLPKSSVYCAIIKYSCVVLLAMSFQAFLSLSVFTYGSEALSKPQLDSLRWVDTWDFLSHDK